MPITLKPKPKNVVTIQKRPFKFITPPMSSKAQRIILMLAAHNQPTNMILWELEQAGFPYAYSYVDKCVVKFREKGWLPKFHPGTNVRCHRGRDGNVILRSSFFDARAINPGKTVFRWGKQTSDDCTPNDDHFSFASKLFHSKFAK